MAAHGLALALSFGWLHLGASAREVGETPRGGGAEISVEKPTEGDGRGTVYGLLRRELEFADYVTLPAPFNAPPGSLVRLRVTPGYREMALADGRHLAVRKAFSPGDYTEIGIDDARNRFSEALEGLNVLSVVDPDREGSYVVTLLPGGRLLDYSQHTSFAFLGELLFVPGRKLHLYQEGRSVGTATIARPHNPSALGVPGFDVGALDIPKPYDESRPLIASLRPLALGEEAMTPEWSALLERPKRLSHGEDHSNYEPVGPLDLDGDGVNEMVFRDYGMEWVGFSIFKLLDGEWRAVYRGGGYGY